MKMSRYLSDFFIRCITVYVKYRTRTYPVCRFVPSCSEYAIKSLNNLGLVRALMHIVLRLLRCHPWSGLPSFCMDNPKSNNQGEI